MIIEVLSVQARDGYYDVLVKANDDLGILSLEASGEPLDGANEVSDWVSAPLRKYAEMSFDPGYGTVTWLEVIRCEAAKALQ